MSTKSDSDFQTPPDIAELMVRRLYLRKGSVILEPTPGEGSIVRELERASYKVFAPNNFWDVSPLSRFDGCVMNPPFTPMINAYKILSTVMQMTSRIVALMPWHTIINSQKRTQAISEFGLQEVIHLPRSVFPGSRVQTCILVMDNDYYSDTIFTIHERKQK